MESPQIPNKKKNKNLLVAVIAIVVVVVVVGSFIGLDYHNLFPPTKKAVPSTIYVYDGPAGPVNSDHLLGGCVLAEMKGGSSPAASAQLMAYLMNPAVQKSFEVSTGFIPVDNSSYSSSPSTTVPSIYSSSNSTVTVYFYTSLSTTDEPFVTSVINNFESHYTNIKVISSYIAATDIVTEIATLVSAKSTENVVTIIDNLDVGTLFYDGYLQNLTSMLSTITAGAGMISAVSSLNNYEEHIFGGTYFMPYLVNIPLVWIDYSAMKGAGITSPPTNDSQLLADAKILDQKYGVGMINMQGHGGSSTSTELYQWMVQFGGNPMVFNDSGDIHAMEYLYNLSAYFSPDYKTSYWATYTGLASNTYTVMDYQWPGSVNLTKLGMTPYNSSDTALNASGAALKSGIFLRDPVAWISTWQTDMDNAWVSIIEDHAAYNNIPSILASENSAMYSFLLGIYNSTYANEYEAGHFTPIIT